MPPTFPFLGGAHDLGAEFLSHRSASGQKVGQVRKFCAERLGVGPRWPW